MKFSIEYDKQPLKFLKHQDKHHVKRIVDKIDEMLLSDPVPHNAVPIVGEHHVFRLRIGNLRALYRVDHQTKRIVIFALDKRARVYD